MGILILLLIVLWVVLAILLTAWSMWFQAFLYTEPSPGLVWRGPVAGAAIAFIVLLWVVADYRSQGRYRPIWESTSTEASKMFPELRITGDGGKEEVYKLAPGSRSDYRLGGLAAGKTLPATPSSDIVAIDGDEKAVFRPERDAKGTFIRRKSGSTAEPLRYVDDKGRVMREGALGQLESFRGGVFFGNVMLNLIFLVACFLAFWLLLRFSWLHALGHAVALGLLLLLFVFPPLLSYAEQVAKKRATAASVGKVWNVRV